MKKFLILLGILFFLVAQVQAAETTWRHSGSEVTGFDYNFTNKYSINNVLWVNGTNLNVSDVRQDLNFNNKNISQIELVNNVNFTDLAQRCPEIICINNIAGTIIVSNRTTGTFYRAVNITDAFNYSISNSQSNSTIKITNAKYTPTEQVRVNKSLNFDFDGTEFIWLTIGKVPFINITGSSTGTTTISANVPIGSSLVTVASTTGINSGDLVKIWDNNIWLNDDSPTIKTGELQKVHSVSGNNILLSSGTIHNYTASNGATVEIIRPISVNIKGIKITNAAPTTDGLAILFNRTLDSSLRDSTLTNGYAGIRVDDAFNTHISENTISNMLLATEGYGVAVIDSSAITQIHQNYFMSNRHGATGGNTGTHPGQTRNYLVYDNVFDNSNIDAVTTAAQAIDAHTGVFSSKFSRNTIYSATTGSSGSTYAISFGGYETIIESNILYNGLGINLRGAIGDSNGTAQIIDNTLFNSSYIYRYQSANSDNLRYVRVCGNTAIGNNTIGIDIRGVNGSFDVCNNYIEWDGKNVISTPQAAIDLSYSMNGNVNDNTIVNPVARGIRAVNVNDTNFANNKVTRGGTKRGTSFEGMLLTGANNNSLHDNMIEVTSGNGGIRIIGDYNIIYNNKINATSANAISTLNNGIKNAFYNNYGAQGFFWGVNSTMNGANNFTAFGAGDTFFNATTVAGGTSVNGMCVALAAGAASWAFIGNNTIGC